MSTRAERSAGSLDRDWWRRTVTVLVHPREAFEALRDDSREAADARQEPLTAVVFLAGIAIFLATGTAGRFLDQQGFSSVDVLFEALLGGMVVALQNFWILGGAVYLGERGSDGTGSYRRARHLVGLATTPFVASLVFVWPVRIGIYGTDLFRRGGSDAGLGGDVFRVLDACFLAWAVALLALGVRTVNGWPWRRSLAALALAAVFVVLLVSLGLVL
jgi:hypothetical protein